MKRLKSFLISLGLLLLLSSCTKKPQPVNYVWTGGEEILSRVPVCIVWYKKVPPPLDTWRSYKSFGQTDAFEMRKIILLLFKPEIKEANPSLKTADKLSLIFYNGRPESLTVREVYFEIKDKTFVGPLGKSNEMAEILLERQEVEPLFYAPWRELGCMHYWDDFERTLRIRQEQQKQAEKEAEAKSRTSDSNEAK